MSLGSLFDFNLLRLDSLYFSGDFGALRLVFLDLDRVILNQNEFLQFLILLPVSFNG